MHAKKALNKSLNKEGKDVYVEKPINFLHDGDLGPQGIHQADMGRWALNKTNHPLRTQGFSNYFVQDNDQETPNIRHLEFEYEDGNILQFEVRGLPANEEGDGCQSFLAKVELQNIGF